MTIGSYLILTPLAIDGIPYDVHFTYYILVKKVKEEAKVDGLYVIHNSLSQGEMSGVSKSDDPCRVRSGVLLSTRLESRKECHYLGWKFQRFRRRYIVPQSSTGGGSHPA